MFVPRDLQGSARAIGVLLTVALTPIGALAQSDPLPSWNDTAPKAAIIEFVEKVSKDGSPDFVPEPERIAVFDNDGTLWVEHPMYVQLAFALDRVKAEAPNHPEWATTQPFQMPSANTHTIAPANSAAWTKPSTARPSTTGPLST
jgi:hypothetical protein